MNQTAKIAGMLSATLLLVCLTSAIAVAQEKSTVWVSLPKVLTLPSSPTVAQEWFDQDNAVLYRSHAIDLIRQTIGCVPKKTTQSTSPIPSTTAAGTTSTATSEPELQTCNSGDKPTFPGDKDYFVIHVLRWKDPATGSNAQSVDKQNWYVFHIGKDGKDDPDWDDNAYGKNNRIFGRRNIYVLYIHFNRKANCEYLARYTVTAKKKTPAYLTHLIGLLQLYGVNTTGGGGEVSGAVWGATHLDTYYVPSDLTFVPAMLPLPTQSAGNTGVATGTPSSTQALSNTTGGATSSTSTSVSAANVAAEPPATTSSLSQQGPSGTSGGAASSTLPAESGVVPPANGSSTAATPEAAANSSAASSSTASSIPTELKLDSQTFDNEGRYHFDFSVAIPIRKISEISYVSASNTLVPTKIDKQTTFGVIDYYFKPVDTKGSGWSLYPHALAGVAIDSHPLKRVLIGGGYGPLLAHFYMGLVLDTQSLPPGGSCGKTPTAVQLSSGNLQNRTCPGFSLGLNVSVGSVLDTLKSKSSTGSGSKTK